MIGAHLIYGANPEPFLEAALRSVDWVDYYCAVNTAPDTDEGRKNEAVVRATVSEGKLRHAQISFPDDEFDFAAARNLALSLADDGDHVLILDADDVHYPEMEAHAKRAVENGCDILTAHYWHLMIYKDLWQSEPHREILFRKTPEVTFTSSVHENLFHPRSNPQLADDYHYCHYGYVKPAREVFRRWQLYSTLEGEPHYYDGRDPDSVLADRLDQCKPFWREHPPAVRTVLDGLPEAPKPPQDGEANVGLVLLTFDDFDLLDDCIASLAHTRQPFELLVLDCGEKLSPVGAFEAIPVVERIGVHGDSLAGSLNLGIKHFLDRPHIQYVGWIHPDHRFDDPRWLECLRHALDAHPDIGKVCAANSKYPVPESPQPGQEQCWLMPRRAVEAFPFDEEFAGIGGREDWDQNRRLLDAGLRVMVWPTVPVYHEGMATRSRRDTDDDGRANAAYYHEKWGTYDPPV